MKLTPRSMALCKAASDVLSSVLPQASPPMPQLPKPITEIFQPVRPNARYSIYYSSFFFCIDYVSVSLLYSDGGFFARAVLGVCRDRGRRGGRVGALCL